MVRYEGQEENRPGDMEEGSGVGRIMKILKSKRQGKILDNKSRTAQGISPNPRTSQLTDGGGSKLYTWMPDANYPGMYAGIHNTGQ